MEAFRLASRTGLNEIIFQYVGFISHVCIHYMLQDIRLHVLQLKTLLTGRHIDEFANLCTIAPKM